MNRITLKSLLILAVFSASSIVCEMNTYGVLVVDNQSDYRIDITFYQYRRQYLTGKILGLDRLDSLSLDPKTEWATSYRKRGGGGINAIRWALDLADSAKIIYGGERISFSPDPDGRDLIYDASSYIETHTKRGLFKNKVDQTNFRYIFTNADYEAAKPITP